MPLSLLLPGAFPCPPRASSVSGRGRGCRLLIKGSALGPWGVAGAARVGWKKSCRITDDSCWCQSVQISYGVWLGRGEKHFLLKKKKSHEKKCLDFSFLTHSVFLYLYLKCALCSLVPLLSLVFNPLSLQEADGADLDAKLLMCFANVHGGDVHNGQARGLLWSIFDQRLAPLSCVFLCRGARNTMAAK